MERIKIGITHGYTNGVGYEVILKAFEEPTLLELCTPIVYGSPKVASYHRKALGLNTNFTTIQHAEEALENRLNIVECIQEEVKVDLGQKTEEADRATTISIDAAKRGLAAKHFDAQVMAPGDKMSTANGTTILINERTRVALLTDNISFSDVSKHITSEEVNRKIADLDRCLKRDFAISGPRIAVLALNPEPGEEEENIIKPAIEQAGDKHIFAMGPFAADTFFEISAATEGGKNLVNQVETGISQPTFAHERSADIYSIDGRLIRRGTPVASVREMTTGLPAGLYIMGKKKIVIR